MLPLPKRMQKGSAAHNRAPHQERDIAKRLKGTTTKASGAKDEKGDVRVRGTVRVEAKCTSNKSFSITREMIEKIESAALGAGEVPYVEVEFVDKFGKKLATVAVMPVWGVDLLVGNQK